MKALHLNGSIRSVLNRYLPVNLWIWLGPVLRNLRFGFRSLLQTPRFTLSAVLIVTLGVGADTAVFSVMDAVLLRSLPVHNPQGLAYLRTSHAPYYANYIDPNATFSWPVYQTLRDQHRFFSEVIAVGWLSNDKVNIRIGKEAEQAEADMVSGNFFSGLEVDMTRGRSFTPKDEADHAQVMVISHKFWTYRFSRDPGVLGKVIYVKGVPFTIIGIAAKSFEGTESGSSLDFWIPLQDRVEFNVLGNPLYRGDLYQRDPEWWCLSLIARLAPGVTREQALAGIQSVFQAAAYTSGSRRKDEPLPVLSFEDAKNFRGYDELYGKPLRILMAMVGFVLLIALTNVVMLLVARNAFRQREFSLRMALGAGRTELFMQLFCEGLLLVITAGALAWGFAFAATRLLAHWVLVETSFTPDRTVLVFTLVVLVISTFIFAVAPFRFALAGGPVLALKTAAITSRSDIGTTRIGKILVTLQIALCVILLVGAGLLVRTLRNLQTVPLGINTGGLVVFGLNPHSLRSQSDFVRFYQDVLHRIRALPQIRSVSITQLRLGSGSMNSYGISLDGNTGKYYDAFWNDGGPDILHTLGIPILQGRDFTDADTPTSQKVVIINDLFAKTYLPRQNPLGHKINDAIIVGVIADHKYTTIEEVPVPMGWWQYAQDKELAAMNIVMRVRGDDPLSILPTVQKIVAQVDPSVPLINPILQREQFEQTIANRLMFARLSEFFAILAILLVATGLYGTHSFRVSRRTAEIGVRMALGARRPQVMWMILRETALLILIGIVAGLPLAVVTGRGLASALYGVRPLDVASYLIAIVVVTSVALIASAIPARRAASVDPAQALRTE
jgi:predicted permease